MTWPDIDQLEVLESRNLVGSETCRFDHMYVILLEILGLRYYDGFQENISMHFQLLIFLRLKKALVCELERGQEMDLNLGDLATR